jgi:hypothetical protein
MVRVSVLVRPTHYRLAPLLAKALPPRTHRMTVWQVVPHPQRPVSLNAILYRKALSMLNVVESAKFSFARPRRSW